MIPRTPAICYTLIFLMLGSAQWAFTQTFAKTYGGDNQLKITTKYKVDESGTAVDDEIEHLKPHIILHQNKNYDVITCKSGQEALEELSQSKVDIVFLDENMPGISGLETLNEIKVMNSGLPVVMITKSEEEFIMEEAIGSKIADYLIKPVNPNQILLSLKKNLDHSRLVSEKTNVFSSDPPIPCPFDQSPSTSFSNANVLATAMSR